MLPPTMKLDVTAFPAPERGRRLLEAFDRLREGGVLRLTWPEDPRPDLRRLEEERPGQFDWMMLEEGDRRFRAEISRRAEEPRTVTAQLAHDHERLHAMLEIAIGLASEDEVRAAGERFAEFRAGLEHHMAIEETVLFPAFERLASEETAGVIGSLRLAHAEIRVRLQLVTSVLHLGGAPSFLREAKRLSTALIAHEANEALLPPLIDRSLSGQAPREALVRQLQEL